MATQPTLMIAMSARLRANTTEFADALPPSLSVVVTLPLHSALVAECAPQRCHDEPYP